MNQLSKALLALTIIISFTSCNNEIENLKIEPDQSSMLVFETTEDFNQAVTESVEIPVAELEDWVKAKGINSFGVEALKRYNSINFEELSSEEELMSIIEENKDYLVLEEIENEFYLETKYHNQANRFVINQDRLVQIGDKVHKIFKNGELKGSLEEIESLKSVSEEQFDQLIKEENETFNGLEIVPIERKVTTSVKRGGYWGTLQERRSTDGRDRTLSRAEIKSRRNDGNVYYTYHFLVRPYKKVMWVWYHCTRTITGEASYMAYAPGQFNVGSVLHQRAYNRRTEYDQKWERNDPKTVYDASDKSSYFYAVAVYGDTPSTPPATFDLR
ncbi:hypothetical protein [Marivirga sp.]|uniref:hypothetical protein n=1 Tax=Marivirga sp. TaxID=2018662 RepID=UPI0025FE363E|nr:hypothetical protein [Marivirga sp.]